MAEVLVQHLLAELLLRREVVRKRALGNSRRRDHVANGRAVESLLEHDPKACVEQRLLV